jgi:hypothetical protein
MTVSDFVCHLGCCMPATNRNRKLYQLYVGGGSIYFCYWEVNWIRDLGFTIEWKYITWCLVLTREELHIQFSKRLSINLLPWRLSSKLMALKQTETKQVYGKTMPDWTNWVTESWDSGKISRDFRLLLRNRPGLIFIIPRDKFKVIANSYLANATSKPQVSRF